MEGTRDTTILVVEDDMAMARALEGFLQRQGYPVVTAGTVREALIAADSEQPDIVLCDRDLGRVDGADLVSALRQSRPDVRYVLMTEPATPPDARSVGVMSVSKGSGLLPGLTSALGIAAR